MPLQPGNFAGAMSSSVTPVCMCITSDSIPLPLPRPASWNIPCSTSLKDLTHIPSCQRYSEFGGIEPGNNEVCHIHVWYRGGTEMAQRWYRGSTSIAITRLLSW